MKASNIYQKLKSAGIGNPDGVSSKPLIKDVGIKSPLNMKSPVKKSLKIEESAGSVSEQTARLHDTPKKKTSYAEAYKKRDMKTYGKLTEAEYTAEAKRQNKSYKKTGKWDAPKKQMESKTTKPSDKTQAVAPDSTTKAKTTAKTTTKTVSTKNKVDVAKEKVGKANQSIKDAKKSVKETRKANKLKEKAARKQKRADRIKKEGGTKVGNFLRKKVKQVKDVVKKKDDSPAKMKKSAAKMKKDSAMKMKKDSSMKMKKESAMKMKKSAMKFNAGLKKAAADGKLDKNPKFKAAVQNAPAKMKKSAMKMKKSAMKMGMKKSAAKMKYKK